MRASLLRWREDAGELILVGLISRHLKVWEVRMGYGREGTTQLCLCIVYQAIHLRNEIYG